MKKQWHLSASLISAFKACPMRCYLKYVLGIIPIEDTDSQRQGTNWNKCLEIMGMKSGQVCPECSNTQKNMECVLCEGTDILPENMMDAVIRHLNKTYDNIPISKTKEEWLTERAILLYSLAGYNWNYSNDNYIVVAEEVKFSLPLRNPSTGRALPNVTIGGIIDKIVQSPNGNYYIDEHKSTSNSLDQDSQYWNHLNLDTQTRLYPWAARQMQLTNDLINYGLSPDDPLISGVRFDAWHKPQIRPKKLTQAESKKFVETGEYMGEKFNINQHKKPGQEVEPFLFINGIKTKIEFGAKEGTFAIRETPEMFGNRLLQDIGQRPEFYFARREINRTESELKRFEWELYNIYKALRSIEKTNTWWINELQCEAKYPCSYIPICYNNININGGCIPEGFKCIFKGK